MLCVKAAKVIEDGFKEYELELAATSLEPQDRHRKGYPLNASQLLLHFLIHIDVLKLCSKFELIPTSIFRVMTTF